MMMIMMTVVYRSQMWSTVIFYACTDTTHADPSLSLPYVEGKLGSPVVVKFTIFLILSTKAYTAGLGYHPICEIGVGQKMKDC